jgi:hypothetical protein
VAFSQLSIQPNRVILDLEGTVIRMPEISLFYGIRVTMYYDDHMPPHFHAEYNGQNILVDILNARIYRGAFPSRQLKMILASAVIHQDELMQNWELAKDHAPLNPIAPLM